VKMDKNWLIRTKSNHILGPVSKEKVQELYRNGSIKPDDEICSGNGFWFFIRENDLIARYLLGDEVQGFNPVSEAKDVSMTEVAQEDLSAAKDFTVVGGISLSMLDKEGGQSENISEINETSPEIPLPPLAEELPKPKKKSKTERIVKESGKVVPQRKQNYLKWVGILGFIILFCLIYFRKTIIKSLFQGEMSSVSSSFTFSFFDEAQAQVVIPTKKKLLDRNVQLDGISFHLRIGLDGFKVVSSFNINELSCENLSNDVHQLGVILHPPELMNEKFLIKIRECMLDMPENHPLKRWLMWIAKVEKRSKKEENAEIFLLEVLNSRFNLITDATLRTKIINHLVEVSETTLGERLLKSYLYLIIGNITKSDNLLQDFINRSPYQNWKGFSPNHSLHSQIAHDRIEQIIVKLANHPADRSTYQLFAQYILSFYQDERFLTLIAQYQGASLRERLKLKFIQRISPHLVNYLKLKQESESNRMIKLRELKEHSLHDQAYWHWAFLNIDFLVSENLVEVLREIEQEEQLWFIYIMDNEKLIDAYSKKLNKSFLLGRRQYLHNLLNGREDFMMALFKLIEFGDIDQDLIGKTIKFLTND
jgi:hypothetical protein